MEGILCCEQPDRLSFFRKENSRARRCYVRQAEFFRSPERDCGYVAYPSVEPGKRESGKRENCPAKFNTTRSFHRLQVHSNATAGVSG
jgi:hypothetical protein